MFKVNDILEVVKKPIGVDLYPGMIVQITQVEYMSQGIGLAFLPTEDIIPYNVKVCVKYPLENCYKVAENIDASVFEPKSSKDISASDFRFNSKYYMDLNTTIHNREKMRYECMNINDPADLKSLPTYVLRNELARRGMRTIRNDEVVDMSNGPKKIIFNYPATICFWPDGTKTVVKCAEGQEFSEYYGFLACLAKKLYGTNGEINRIINKNKEYGDGHEDMIAKTDDAKDCELVNAAVKIHRLQESLNKAQATTDRFRNAFNSLNEQLLKFINKVPLGRNSKRVLMAHAKKTFPEIFED